jgi:hypothetical protein
MLPLPSPENVQFVFGDVNSWVVEEKAFHLYPIHVKSKWKASVQMAGCQTGTDIKTQSSNKL